MKIKVLLILVMLLVFKGAEAQETSVCISLNDKALAIYSTSSSLVNAPLKSENHSNDCNSQQEVAEVSENAAIKSVEGLVAVSCDKSVIEPGEAMKRAAAQGCKLSVRNKKLSLAEDIKYGCAVAASSVLKL